MMFYLKLEILPHISFVPVPGSTLGAGILSDTSFKALEEAVSELTLKGIADMGFTNMTKIQADSIPHLLEGR